MNLFELLGVIGAIVGLSLGIYFGAGYGIIGVTIGILIGIVGGYISGILTTFPFMFILSVLTFITKPIDLLFDSLLQLNHRRHKLPSIIQDNKNKKQN